MPAKIRDFIRDCAYFEIQSESDSAYLVCFKIALHLLFFITRVRRNVVQHQGKSFMNEGKASHM